MNITEAAITGGIAFTAAIILGTVVNRLVPRGGPRRGCEEIALLLACAAPGLTVLGGVSHRYLLYGVAVVGIAYGGFYAIRMQQLKHADRDGVRRLLGLGKNASFGEAASAAERITPAPLTTTGRLVIAATAFVIVAVGIALGRFDTALVGLALGAGEVSVRPAYHRALATKVRDIGH